MSKGRTFNISMPGDLVKRIDQQSKLQAASRSDFIRQAVRKQLSALEKWQTTTNAARIEYKGKPLTEAEVAKIIRQDRSGKRS